MGQRRTNGFTLIELIIVMVILAILGVFSFAYVTFGARIFADTSARQQLVAESRFAIERLTRELKYIVPRSARVSNGCIEFVPLLASSRYLELPLTSTGASDDFVAIAPQAQSSLVGQWLFVYPTQPQHVYALTSARRQQIQSSSAVSGQPNLIEITFNGANAEFSQQSPGRRYYVGSSPISWCYDAANAQLLRFENYGIIATQPNHTTLLGTAGSAEVMLNGLVNDLGAGQFPFTVSPASLQRNSLILFDWSLLSPSGERMQINHEVHLPNVP
ncbi:hypothetical protein CWE21_03705 [Pseudidiomarina aquimaris]|uniref:MSHA biogenesis protein MshO n=1 Tax=Pseudidiomarina aquimaris TaxID=641841 RepID=A0A432XNH3_9GAMM|nr:prepilin-type N-terminal cleavage/methylation domain-containing protein [Pseudidiomarina aquimaris]RUO50232.1 hypothetical protein CWE21_03705 [Pseudidiomarina aquimaris]